MLGFLKKRLMDRMRAYVTAIQLATFENLGAELGKQYGAERGAAMAGAVTNRLFGSTPSPAHASISPAETDGIATGLLRHGDQQLSRGIIMSLRTLATIEADSQNMDAMDRIGDTLMWISSVIPLPPESPDPEMMRSLAASLWSRYCEGEDSRRPGGGAPMSTRGMEPQSATSGSETAWYYAKAGRSEGPVAQSKMIEMLQTGELQRHVLVWSRRMQQWTPASTVKELETETTNAPPSVPPDGPAIPPIGIRSTAAPEQLPGSKVMLPQWLRWILVLPAAIGAYAGIQIVVIVGNTFCPGPQVFIQYFCQFVNSVAAPYCFVLAGARTAPRYRLVAAIALVVVLAVLYGSVTTLAVVQGRMGVYDQLHSDPLWWVITSSIIGIVASGAACLHVYRAQAVPQPIL